MDTEKPSYYAIIPANVRYDKTLRANEKLLYGDITTLTNKTGECWASNNYFARLYEVTPQAISKWINDLADKGYIKITYKRKHKLIEKRVIQLGVSTNVYGGINKYSQGYQQMFKENNTSNNITSRIYALRQHKQEYNNKTLTDNLEELFDN